MKKLHERMHFANFYVAGFNYYDGCMVIEELKVGSRLELVRDEYNKVDVNAIAIYYKFRLLRWLMDAKNETLDYFLSLLAP